MVIGFNADFLVEFLKNATRPAKIQFRDGKSPAIFTDATPDLVTEFTALVMPMYIDTPLLRLADLPADVDGWQYERRPSAPASNPFDHTFLKHAPDFGTHGWISDDTWIPALPEPGAQLHEIKTIWSYWENFDPWDRGRRQYDARLIMLHLAGGLPDPNAPIAVDLGTQIGKNVTDLIVFSDVLSDTLLEDLIDVGKFICYIKTPGELKRALVICAKTSNGHETVTGSIYLQ